MPRRRAARTRRRARGHAADDRQPGTSPAWPSTGRARRTSRGTARRATSPRCTSAAFRAGRARATSRRTIAAPGTTLSRPFVTVDGATVRVVSYRYGLTGARFDQIWEFTSADGGATFDAGHPVGIAPFDEAVRGPGNTLTVTTNAESTGLAVQNVPLDGTTPATARPSSRPTTPTTAPWASRRAGGQHGEWHHRRLRRRLEPGAVPPFGSLRRPERRGGLDAAGRHRLRRLPAPGRRPVGPLPALGDAGERPHRAQVRRRHVRRRREDRRRRRRRAGPSDPGRGRAPARRLRPRHRRRPRARLRDVGQRHAAGSRGRC